MSLKSFWHKSFAPLKPWVEVTIVDGQPVVLDYNEAFIEEQRTKAGVMGVGKSEEELIKFFLNPDYFAAQVREAERLAAEEAARVEAERIAAEEPKMEISIDASGKIVPVRWNDAFIREQREKLGAITEGKTDEEVVKLFMDRDYLAKEEPKLEVLHMGIEADGKVKVELDWNQAFIRHLRDHGITGETEDEAIQNYLTMLTHNELQDADPEEFFSKDQLQSAFAELDQQLEAELEEARKSGLKSRRRKVK